MQLAANGGRPVARIASRELGKPPATQANHSHPSGHQPSRGHMMYTCACAGTHTTRTHARTRGRTPHTATRTTVMLMPSTYTHIHTHTHTLTLVTQTTRRTTRHRHRAKSYYSISSLTSSSHSQVTGAHAARRTQHATLQLISREQAGAQPALQRAPPMPNANAQVKVKVVLSYVIHLIKYGYHAKASQGLGTGQTTHCPNGKGLGNGQTTHCSNGSDSRPPARPAHRGPQPTRSIMGLEPGSRRY
jgi:hypothetical protein